MLLARSDPDVPKHKGLTYFILDMEQDAVDVRPLRQITGEAEFNEIFMEDAYVPDENVVGGVGNGWMVGITTLMHERAGLGAASAVALRRDLDELIALVNERGLGDDPVIRDRDRATSDRHEALRLGGLRDPDPDDAHRHPRPRGIARQVAVGRGQSGADRAGDRGARPRGARAERMEPTASCARGPTRSRAGRPR